MHELSMREWSALLSVLAFAGLTWRMIGYFGEMTVLERILSAVLMGFLIAGAVGTYNLDRHDAPPSGVLPWAMALRVLCLALVVVWPRLVGRTRELLLGLPT